MLWLIAAIIKASCTPSQVSAVHGVMKQEHWKSASLGQGRLFL